MGRALIIMLLATAVQAGETYKWTDAEGDLHYTQTPPPPGAKHEGTLYYDAEAEYERQMRDLAVQRQMEQLARERAGIPEPGAGTPYIVERRSGPAPLGYRDKQKLREIERDIERLSGSGIGDPVSRRNQIQSLERQRELIESKEGAIGSPQITINRGIPRNY